MCTCTSPVHERPVFISLCIYSKIKTINCLGSCLICNVIKNEIWIRIIEMCTREYYRIVTAAICSKVNSRIIPITIIVCRSYIRPSIGKWICTELEAVVSTITCEPKAISKSVTLRKSTSVEGVRELIRSRATLEYAPSVSVRLYYTINYLPCQPISSTAGNRAFSAAVCRHIFPTNCTLKQPCLNRLSGKHRRVIPGNRVCVWIMDLSFKIPAIHA